MRPELHDTYTAYRKEAGILGLDIDFKRNFEEWFEKQLEQLGHELHKIKAVQSGINQTSTHQSCDLQASPLERHPGTPPKHS